MAKLAAFVAVCAAGLSFSPSAEACREHCRIRARGAIRVAVPPFGVEVGWPRARIVIRGPIIGYGVADNGPPPPPPIIEAPEPPPPPPEPYYAPPEPAGNVYSVSRPREPNIGVGIRGSALRVGRDGPGATGYGLLLRFKARPIELELEVGREDYREGVERSDTRVGGSLYVPLVSGRLVPFLVAGAGMNFSHFGDTGDELHQGYLAGGGGLGLRLGSRFVVSADARYMLRRFFDSEAKVDAQGVTITNDEPHGMRDEAVELRLNGVLYF